MTDPESSPSIGPGSRREVFAWALYDWANSAYTTLSITVLVIYLNEFVVAPETATAQRFSRWAASIGITVRDSQWGPIVWGWGLALSMLAAAVASPILGAIADARASKRKWLAGTAFLGASMAVAMAFVPQSGGLLIIAMFVLMAASFDLSFGFYNGFLPEIADESSMNRVSAWGFALGYIGGGVALAIGFVIVMGGQFSPPVRSRLHQDFHCLREGSFAVHVPPGRYEVVVTLGDADLARDNVQVTVADQPPALVSTAAGEFQAVSHFVERSDDPQGGDIVVRFGGPGDDDRRQAAVCGIEVQSTDGPFLARFDFGCTGSATEPGFIWVTPIDTYRRWELKAVTTSGESDVKNVDISAAEFRDSMQRETPGAIRFGWQGGDVGCADRVLPARLRMGLLLMGLWWGGFAIPTVWILRDRGVPRGERQRIWRAAASGVREVGRTLRHIRRYRMLAIFLLAFLFFNDGIQTVISQSPIFATKELHFTTTELMTLILAFQFICFPGAILLGRLADRLGQKPTLVLCLLTWIGLLATAYVVTEKWHYWCLSVVLGIVMGGTQSISRAIMGVMTPKDRTAEFFGFYNLSGKATSWMGNLMFPTVMALTQSARLAVVALLVFFVIGLLLTLKIDVAKGAQQAKEST